MMFKPSCFPLGEFAKPLNLSVGEEYSPLVLSWPGLQSCLLDI